LSTLQSMNVKMGDLRESLSIRPDAAAAATPSPRRSSKADPGAAQATPAASVDPMQWWGALTKQFTELASAAVKDSAKSAALDTAKAFAGSAIQQGLDAAGKSLQKAVGVAGGAARRAAAPARKPRG
jgi:hypothetical protein